MPESATRFNVVMNGVSSARYMAWLAQLEAELPLTIETLEVQRDRPGFVRADMTLRDLRR